MMELQVIQNKIHEIRGCRIILDYELATLYQIETKVLKQAVRRNIQRFPEDFMFELSKEEYAALRSQFVTLKSEGNDCQKDTNLRSQSVTSSWGGSRYLPFAFTELCQPLHNSDYVNKKIM